MRNCILVVALGLGVASVASLPVSSAAPTTEKSEAGEVTVKMEDCPKAVQDTIKKEVGSGTISQITRETEKGKTIYEAEAKIDGKAYEINVAEDGTRLSKKIDDDDEKKEGGEKHGEKEKHEDKD